MFPKSKLAFRLSLVVGVLVFATVVVGRAATPALAQNPAGAKVPVINYNPQVPIPGSSEEARALQQNRTVSENLLGQYVVTIYRFGIWLAITLAIFMMMVGGFLWVIAGGNPSRVDNAKSYITAALTGLVVALTSFLILQTVNPALVIFKPLRPTAWQCVGGSKEGTPCYRDDECPGGRCAFADPRVQSAEALNNFNCRPELVVTDYINTCDQACGGAGLGAAKRLEGKTEPYAPRIPRSAPTRYCCACQNSPCLEEGKNCALASGARCCTPLVCNTGGYFTNSCAPYGETENDSCDNGQDCLSGLCFDARGPDNYCVPVGGFADGKECNLDEECLSGHVCSYAEAPSEQYVITYECHPRRERDEFCWENKDCVSNACDTTGNKCL